MTKYFLFGKEAVDCYLDGDLIKIKDCDYDVFAYDNNSSINHLLDAYTGWESYVQIEETDYLIITGEEVEINN